MPSERTGLFLTSVLKVQSIYALINLNIVKIFNCSQNNNKFY